jgi:hypothetical protein
MQGRGDVEERFRNFIGNESYPCVAARAALAREQISVLVVDHIGCPKDDASILDFLYSFIYKYRKATTALHSAAVIFRQPPAISEEEFDRLLWQRLQSLSSMDALRFPYDRRVNRDPMAADFSYSLGEEAFFIIGLNPGSSRPSRRFSFPTIVFNPHEQFETLRKGHHYEKMKNIVRKRDVIYSGSINPMLADFGEASETLQYSGRQHSEEWTCPLKITHERTEDHPSPK